jgi:uncharacterized membrane protein YdfJ with MMPL/SSD domain
VAVLWLLLALVALVAALRGATHVDSRIAPPDVESQHATDLLPDIVPGGQFPDSETVVIHLDGVDLRSPTERPQIEAIVATLGKVPGVAAAISPFSPGSEIAAGANPVSADGDTVLVSVIMKSPALHPDLTAVKHLEETARAHAVDGMRVELVGPGITTAVQGHISFLPLALGGLVALVILRIALGAPAAVAAAAVPALVTTASGQVAVGLVSRAQPIAALSPVLALIVGLVVSLGVGILVVHRTQLGMRVGLDAPEAAAQAMTWAGRAGILGGECLVVVSVVCWAAGIAGFSDYAPAVLMVTVLAAVSVATLLPAVLALSKRRLLPWAERGRVRRTGTGAPRRAGMRSWWAWQVGRYPRPIAIIAAVMLAGLVIPALGLRLGASDAGVDPTSTTTRRAYDLIGQEFNPGLTGPMIVVATDTTRYGKDAGAKLAAAVGSTPGVASAQVVVDRPEIGMSLIRAIPAGEPRSAATAQLLTRLRTRTVPSVVGQSGMRVYIGGQSALFADTAAQLRHALPVFITLVGLVVGLASLSLLRSFLVAAIVIGSELVSLGAVVGIIALFTRDDLLAAVLGVRTGPFEPFAVAFIVFGAFALTVGMHLGLLVRMRAVRWIEPTAGRPDAGKTVPIRRLDSRDFFDQLPAYHALDGGEPRRRRELVRARHADAAAITLAISAIVFPLFIGFALQHQRLLAVLGAVLAVVVAVDALILRGALLPGVLHLLPAGGGQPRGPARPARTRRATGLSDATRPPAGASGGRDVEVARVRGLYADPRRPATDDSGPRGRRFAVHREPGAGHGGPAEEVYADDVYARNEPPRPVWPHPAPTPPPRRADDPGEPAPLYASDRRQTGASSPRY